MTVVKHNLLYMLLGGEKKSLETAVKSGITEGRKSFNYDFSNTLLRLF